MTPEPTPRLTPALLAELASHAESIGLLRLGAVALDHPGFAPAHAALDRFLAADKAGEMDFLVRTASVRKHPAQMLPGAQSLLVAAVPYTGEPGPVARYARTRDYHTVIHHRLIALEHRLHALLPGVATLICVDTNPVLERSAAALAGLGFLGKHGCLIIPGLGSYVLLGEILTTAEFTAPSTLPKSPPWDACGACTRCLDACPTAAFDAPGDLDPRRCISYLTIEHRGEIADHLADHMGERVAGCDVCQEVCPYNASSARDRRVPAVAWIDPAPRPLADVDGLAAISPSQYRAQVRHLAVRRIPRRHMRRNALLALGNRSGEVGPRELHAVALGLLDRDPQIAAAARRAALRREITDAAHALAETLRAASPRAPDEDSTDDPRDCP
jgi:epoxyqueuosine reductase